jgi:hypothetical protein
MHLLTPEKVNTPNGKELLDIVCENCGQIFAKPKSFVRRCLKLQTSGTKWEKNAGKFCSRKCANNFLGKSKVKCSCDGCGTLFDSYRYRQRLYSRIYCSNECKLKSCQCEAGSLLTKRPQHLSHRSKLEIWIEKELSNFFPSLDILFGNTSLIGSELDIAIPSLDLAFELNGIFHYAAIFGELKLSKIQANDAKKINACLDKNIELYVLDTSKQTNFSEKSSKEFLDYIVELINAKILNKTDCTT